MCKIIFKIPSKIAFVIMLTFLIGCPGIGEPTGDSTIEIVNNSDESIDFYVDSSYVLRKNSPFSNLQLYIKPKSSKKFHSWWLSEFRTFSSLYLFIFDLNVLDTVPWDSIRKYELYWREKLTKAKLDSLNWTITYP